MSSPYMSSRFQKVDTEGKLLSVLSASKIPSIRVLGEGWDFDFLNVPKLCDLTILPSVCA